MSRLWSKGESLDETILRFTVGNDHLLDERLVAYDVRASCAHARMLGQCGYLSASDVDRLCETLVLIGDQHQSGEWHIALEEEDCHTALENRLTESLGDLGGRIHLGRSRNDQVLTALRLYLKVAAGLIRTKGAAVADRLEELASRQGDVALPGYTHLQRAMPSSVADWSRGFASELTASLSALDAAISLADVNPLGSAAGYGTPGLELDRAMTTRELGFTHVQQPVTSCQLSRGKAEASLAFAISLILGDLGRLAADLCLFSTSEFGFVELPHSMTTGSSIMPQKRNPDVFELVRAHAAQAPSHLLAILSLTAKMPSGYHRDLQLIKAPLFASIDACVACLEVMELAIPGIRFVPARTQAAMTEDLYAAERAFQLVKEEGIPFREAYRRVASLVT